MDEEDTGSSDEIPAAVPQPFSHLQEGKLRTGPQPSRVVAFQGQFMLQRLGTHFLQGTVGRDKMTQIWKLPAHYIGCGIGQEKGVQMIALGAVSEEQRELRGAPRREE